MKKLLLAFLLLPALSNAQAPSCCALSGTQQFSMLASNEDFVASHIAPEPFVYAVENGSMITYPCSDGKDANAFVIKSPKQSNRWLLVFHEWWGLNDYIKQEAEKWQKELGDINVMAVDLYDGKIAETPATAQAIMGGLDQNRATTIIRGALKHAGPQAKIYTIGWCMGGGFSFNATIMAEKQGVACVMYYGMPEMDSTKVQKINADVLGLFAKKDKWITPEVVAKFQAMMKKENKKLTVKSYDADHAFANPSNPNHDKAATADAHAVALAFLKARMTK